MDADSEGLQSRVGVLFAKSRLSKMLLGLRRQSEPARRQNPCIQNFPRPETQRELLGACSTRGTFPKVSDGLPE